MHKVKMKNDFTSKMNSAKQKKLKIYFADELIDNWCESQVNAIRFFIIVLCQLVKVEV